MRASQLLILLAVERPSGERLNWQYYATRFAAELGEVDDGTARISSIRRCLCHSYGFFSEASKCTEAQLVTTLLRLTASQLGGLSWHVGSYVLVYLPCLHYSNSIGRRVCAQCAIVLESLRGVAPGGVFLFRI